MARRNRPSQLKREREQKKRQRQRSKADKAASKRERRFGDAEAETNGVDDARVITLDEEGHPIETSDAIDPSTQQESHENERDEA